MNKNVNWGIAKIHLLARRRQTIVAILGVTFGISMFVLMMSFMKGINEFLQEAMLSSTPDIRIYNEIKTDYTSSITDEYFKRDPNTITIVDHPKPKNINRNLKNINNIIKEIRQNNRVVAASPVLSAQVFFNYGSAQINGIIDGVNINEEKKVLNLSDKMIEGRPEDLIGAKNGVLLGQRLAENLNVHSGDLLTVSTVSGSVAQLQVMGIFQFGLGAVDNVKGIMNLSNVQQLLGKDDFVTDVHVKLKNIDESKNLATAFAEKFGYRADDWATANAAILSTVVARDVSAYVIGIAMLVVAGFGIYNIMNITITNKLKDIAILKAQGFTGKDIATIFLSQSIVIGCIGAILGMALGFVLSYILSRVPFPKSDIVSFRFYPVVFKMKYYVFAALFGMVTTFIAVLMPSVKASKSDPVTILRG